MLVQSQSGTVYQMNGHWIYRLDGLGRPRAFTCWYVDFQFPACDQVWALRLALRFDEARMLAVLPWRPYH